MSQQQFEITRNHQETNDFQRNLSRAILNDECQPIVGLGGFGFVVVGMLDQTNKCVDSLLFPLISVCPPLSVSVYPHQLRFECLDAIVIVTFECLDAIVIVTVLTIKGLQQDRRILRSARPTVLL